MRIYDQSDQSKIFLAFWWPFLDRLNTLCIYLIVHSNQPIASRLLQRSKTKIKFNIKQFPAAVLLQWLHRKQHLLWLHEIVTLPSILNDCNQFGCSCLNSLERMILMLIQDGNWLITNISWVLLYSDVNSYKRANCNL